MTISKQKGTWALICLCACICVSCQNHSNRQSTLPSTSNTQKTTSAVQISELAGIGRQEQSEITLDPVNRTRKEIYRNASGYPERTILDKFNEQGWVLTHTEKNARGTITLQQQFEYDADGNAIRSTITAGKDKGQVITYKILKRSPWRHWTEREVIIDNKIQETEIRTLEYDEGDSIPRIISTSKKL